MQVIPQIAWEQAVYVSLFIVFVIGLLSWFSNQSDKWQRFMFDIDEKWRGFNRDQREDHKCTERDVNNSLTALTTATAGLVSEVKEMRTDNQNFYTQFGAHDVKAQEILALVNKPPSRRSGTKTVATQTTDVETTNTAQPIPKVEAK